MISIGSESRVIKLKMLQLYSDTHIMKKLLERGNTFRYNGRLTEYTKNNATITQDTQFVFCNCELTIPDLIHLKQKGIIAIIIKDTILVEISDVERIPLMFTFDVNYETELKNLCNHLVTLKVDMSMYKYYKVYNNVGIIYNKKLDKNTISRRICNTIEDIANLSYLVQPVNTLLILYFCDKEELYTYTGFHNTYAYKDRFVAIVYNPYHCNTEYHELTHILFHNFGDTTFLLKEGLATMMYESITKKEWRRYVFNLSVYGRMKRNLSIVSLEQLIDVVKTDRIYNGDDYYVAASFVNWIYRRYGIECIIKCYQIMNRKKTSKENKEIFKEITNIDYFDAVNIWKEEIVHLDQGDYYE